MKRILQAPDNSSSQRLRIDMPATGAPPPGAATSRAPTVKADNRKVEVGLLATQGFFSDVARQDITGLKRNLALIKDMINMTNRASGLTPLMLAVKSRSAEVANWLISQGASLELPCARGTSALMYAAKRGDCDMIRLLLAAGALVEQADPDQRTALQHAAMQGRMEAVAFLLDQGAVLEHQDADGNTALLLAVISQHAALAGLLVERGANAAHVNRDGLFPLGSVRSEAVAVALLRKPLELQQQSEWHTTALIQASALGACGIARLLLDHDARIDFADNKGCTALSVAIEAKQHGMVKLLLERKANPDCTIPMQPPGRTCMFGVAARYNDIAAMELLFQAGGDINQGGKALIPAICIAAHWGHREAVHWLLEKNAIVNTSEDDGPTALVLACAKGYADVAELLLKHNASPAREGGRMFSALHVAVRYGKHECVTLLLKSGATLEEKTGSDFFALHLAAEKGHRDIVELLLAHKVDIDQTDGKGITALMHAAMHGHLMALKFLLRKNANCDARTPGGRSALHLAASAGKHEAVAELIKEQDIDIDSADKEGVTALHLAATNGHDDTVRRLLNNGANPCEVSQFGWNALHCAAYGGHATIVETLASGERAMALINHANGAGMTPLHLAAQSGKADVVRVMAEHGANLRACVRGGGRTALHLGAMHGHPKVAEVLLLAMTLLPRKPGNPAPDMQIVQEAMRDAIAHRHAGVVEVFLRSQPGLASLDFQWHVSPVVTDLRNKVHLVLSPQDANDAQVDRFPGLDNCVERFVPLIELNPRPDDKASTIPLDWLASSAWYAMITQKLQEATRGIGVLRGTLAGPESLVSPAQTRLICAGLLASLGEPSIFDTPYSGKGLSPGVEACFNRLALHQARLLAQAGQEAEQALVGAVGNLHGTCMSAFAGKPFHQINLYLYLTRQYGLYDIPAKRISDAYAEVWGQHRQSDAAVRERAFAQALANRSRSQEALEPIAHDSAQAGNEAMFHWLLNRQLDLVNAWHRKVLGTALPAQ